MNGIHARFRTIRLIADEDTTTIWSCYDKKTGRRMALKVPKVGCEQTKREAELVPRFVHPNIMRMEETIETVNGPACVYREAMGDLYWYLDSAMGEPEVRAIARGLLKAVEYLHSRGIVHRDIKPESVLVLEQPFGEGGIALTDFGFARRLPESGVIEDDHNGSRLYSAPEVMLGRAYGKAAGMWSIGLVLFACLTGGLPFECDEGGMLDVAVHGLPGLFDCPELRHVSRVGRRLVCDLLCLEAEGRPTATAALESEWFRQGEVGRSAREDMVGGLDRGLGGVM
jgi:serine/threonine protein kinase